MGSLRDDWREPKIGERSNDMEWRGNKLGWQRVREHIHDACIVDAKAGEPPRATVRPYDPPVGHRRFSKDDLGVVIVEEWRGGSLGWQSVARLADEPTAPPPRLETDSAKRKDVPIYSGVIRYFPDALADLAALAKAGNDKHNPGEPLHWSRNKSDDHLDCLARHLTEAGTLDSDGYYHDLKILWRAFANYQTLIERVRGLPISPGSKL